MIGFAIKARSHKLADKVGELNGILNAHALDKESLIVEEMRVFAELFLGAALAESFQLAEYSVIGVDL